MGPKPKSAKKAPGAAAGFDRDASIATNEYPLSPRFVWRCLFIHCRCAFLDHRNLGRDRRVSTDELRKRVEEAEAQLREEAKIIERMTRDNRSKQEQINQMEALLQRENERHQASVKMLEDEALTQRLQAEHEIEILRRKVSQLELHVESYDVLETSNHTLRERLDRVLQQHEEENRAHAEEIHKVRLDMFNHKMALEKTFRKALQELDAEYLKKAFNAMSEESKNALVANAKLKDELQLQSIGVDNLMQRFNNQAHHYQKMKIENEILEQESQLRLQTVSSMKKAQLNAARTIERLQEEASKEDQVWRQEASATIEELRKENQQLHRLHEQAQVNTPRFGKLLERRCTKWKTRCLDLADRETKRRMDEQRAQTAPTLSPGFVSLGRAQSQPTFTIATLPYDPHAYDELWNATLSAKSSSGDGPTTTSKDLDPRVELERLASRDLRARTAQPHLVVLFLGWMPRCWVPTHSFRASSCSSSSMKAPDAALLRGRAKGPLAELAVLYLSSASLHVLRNLGACRRLRTLHAEDNELRDLGGLLELRGLWRLGLSDNPPLRDLRALGAFTALGFVHLERTSVTMAALVCLRDVHVLELRLGGTRAQLEQPSMTEYRARVLALLPYVWILDGRFITAHERLEALETQDAFVMGLLESAQATDSVTMTTTTTPNQPTVSLRFGSTTELWGPRVGITLDVATGGAGDGDEPLGSEETLALLECIMKQPTRRPELQDLHRLRAIAEFHDRECDVHNAHCHLAPGRPHGNRPMPRIQLGALRRLPRGLRLEVTVLLAAHGDFALPRSLVVEALAVALLGSNESIALEDLVSLPPYGHTALLSLLRQHALEEEDTLQRNGQLTRSDPRHVADRRLWRSLPVVVLGNAQANSSVQQEEQGQPVAVLTQRCAVAVALLARAASFPSSLGADGNNKLSASSLPPSPELSRLVDATRPVATALDTLDALGLPVPSLLLYPDSDRKAPVTSLTKALELGPEREYPQPWKEPIKVLTGRTTPTSGDEGEAPGKTTTQTPPADHGHRRRRPRVGDWLEIRPRQYLRVQELSSDGLFVLASSTPSDTGGRPSTMTIRVETLTRISGSTWRLQPARTLHLQQETESPQPRHRLGRLHRDSEGFHRHGAARNQGYPNRALTEADVTAAVGAMAEEGPEAQDHPMTTSQRSAPRPAAIYSANDTLDANFVLTAPGLIALQNACAVRAFEETRQPPRGLWSPIKAATYRVVEPLTVATSPSGVQSAVGPASSSTGDRGARATVTAMPRSVTKSKAAPRRASNVGAAAAEAVGDDIGTDDWHLIQREMQAILGRGPSGDRGDDVACFLTAIPEGRPELALVEEDPASSSSMATASATPAAMALSTEAPPSSSSLLGTSSPMPTTKSTNTTPKPRKLAGLAWHQVPTKPQLLIASSCSSSSTRPMAMAPPLTRAKSLDALGPTVGHGETAALGGDSTGSSSSAAAVATDALASSSSSPPSSSSNNSSSGGRRSVVTIRLSHSAICLPSLPGPPLAGVEVPNAKSR